MNEREPTPIFRGVELQKKKIEEIQKKAIDRYKDLVELDKKLEEKLDAVLSQSPMGGNSNEIATLFEQKHVLEQIGHELEELILRGFEHQNQLEERWLVLEQRFSDFEHS